MQFFSGAQTAQPGKEKKRPIGIYSSYGENSGEKQKNGKDQNHKQN